MRLYEGSLQATFKERVLAGTHAQLQTAPRTIDNGAINRKVSVERINHGPQVWKALAKTGSLVTCKFNSLPATANGLRLLPLIFRNKV